MRAELDDMNAETTRTLDGLTVLVPPVIADELVNEFDRRGARLIYWPRRDVRTPDSRAGLDEAIASLFGYDWLIFPNANAVTFFLRRFEELGHEICEMDGLRVCVVGEAAVRALEAAQVHLDVIPDGLISSTMLEALAAYAGGREALRGLTFLVPGAVTCRLNLQGALEEAGARVDIVFAYRTCSANESGRTTAILAGGGIDCVAFTKASDVVDFAEVFDTNDLEQLLDGVAVACVDEQTAQAATAHGLTVDFIL